MSFGEATRNINKRIRSLSTCPEFIEGCRSGESFLVKYEARPFPQRGCFAIDRLRDRASFSCYFYFLQIIFDIRQDIFQFGRVLAASLCQLRAPAAATANLCGDGLGQVAGVQALLNARV